MRVKAAMGALVMIGLTLWAGGAEGPAGLWHFDETGGEALTDSVDANPGKLQPGEEAPFRIGGALAFDGIRTYATFPPGAFWDFDKAWSVSVWVCPRKRPVELATILTTGSQWYLQMSGAGTVVAGQYRWLDADETSYEYLSVGSDRPIP
ncbi:MAG: hypothetical protein V2A58_14610, partial [Planctomycetota bacterium]